MTVHGSKKICLDHYPNIEEPLLTRTVWLTIAILVLSILIENVVHSEFKDEDAPAKTETPASTETVDSPNPTSDPESQAKSPEKVKNVLRGCNPNPTANVRAARFVIATFLLVPTCVAFIYRLKDATREYPWYCHRSDVNITPTNWWFTTILTILPFTCACTAWLRTIVECVLWRWNKSLGYKYWQVCLPIVALGWVTIFPVVFVGGLLWFFVMWMMGFPTFKKGEEDVEMTTNQDEESQGLIENVEREDDELTAYSPRGSGELKAGELDVKGGERV